MPLQHPSCRHILACLRTHEVKRQGRAPVSMFRDPSSNHLLAGSPTHLTAKQHPSQLKTGREVREIARLKAPIVVRRRCSQGGQVVTALLVAVLRHNHGIHGTPACAHCVARVDDHRARCVGVRFRGGHAVGQLLQIKQAGHQHDGSPMWPGCRSYRSNVRACYRPRGLCCSSLACAGSSHAAAKYDESCCHYGTHTACAARLPFPYRPSSGARWTPDLGHGPTAGAGERFRAPGAPAAFWSGGDARIVPVAKPAGCLHEKWPVTFPGCTLHRCTPLVTASLLCFAMGRQSPSPVSNSCRSIPSASDSNDGMDHDGTEEVGVNVWLGHAPDAWWQFWWAIRLCKELSCQDARALYERLERLGCIAVRPLHKLVLLQVFCCWPRDRVLHHIPQLTLTQVYNSPATFLDGLLTFNAIIQTFQLWQDLA